MARQTYRILLIDDDEDDYLLTRSLLVSQNNGQFTLQWANAFEAGLEFLLAEPFDAALVDYYLDSRTGIELIREACSRGCNTPLILITGRGKYEVDLEAMQAGAVDYLNKNEITSPALERTIRYAIERKQTERALRAARDELDLRVQERTHELQQAVGALQDELAERKRIETELRLSNEMFESLYESSPDAILLVDRSGRVARTNRQAKAEFGFKDEELVGEPVERLLSKRIKEQSLRLAEAATNSSNGQSAGLELYAQRHDGFEFPVDVRLSPLEQDGEGQVICVFRNITRRKRMEAELAEVQRRLLDFAETERLRIAQELHDGPMQQLIANSYQLSSLQDSLIDEKSNVQFKNIQTDIKQVVQTLREMCRDMRPPTLTPFGLEKAIRSHADQYQRDHPEVRLHLDLAEDRKSLPEKVRLALFRIYQQAMANVAQHSQAFHVRVRFTIDSDQINLEIQDDGIGFIVPDQWIQTAREGHLGLIGAAERAEAVGGKLKVISTPGVGTAIQVSVSRRAISES